MTHNPNLILYVADIEASTAFYTQALGLTVQMQAPGFAMLTFESCRNVEVSGNSIDPEALGRKVDLKDMSDEELTLDPEQNLVGP